MSDVYVAFRSTDVGLEKTTGITLNVCKFLSNAADVNSLLWTVTEYGLGFYKISVPETELPIFISVQNVAALPTVVKCESTSSDEGFSMLLADIAALLAEKAATAAAIRIEMDTNSTRLAAINDDTDEILERLDVMAPNNVFTAESLANLPHASVIGGIGSGNVLFKWYEYEQGHQGEAQYAVSGVICAVWNNEAATGDPEASAVTDETGCAVMWLNAGTYYLFRRKAGRAFVNPTRVVVSHVVGDSVEEDALAQDYVEFTWYEYEDGHEGDPNYAVADVDIVVWDNELQGGDPSATVRTDATGACSFFVPAGTYYLFRSKTGRVFTNPVEVIVG